MHLGLRRVWKCWPSCSWAAPAVLLPAGLTVLKQVLSESKKLFLGLFCFSFLSCCCSCYFIQVQFVFTAHLGENPGSVMQFGHSKSFPSWKHSRWGSWKSQQSFGCAMFWDETSFLHLTIMHNLVFHTTPVHFVSLLFHFISSPTTGWPL